ncbi:MULTISPECIES: division/cell wall cluster transcriptional repressor MraZ [Candidatus Methylopumilus]|uniref:division/cell wall cluster transcriptional repressor MraZ n=1 Tax=Candidatus Methylopumilus TaxID=1679002 RepID=UPI00111F3F56|nr:division/cell wall cluster transcriptional repressor MraZ [Candidatus Methylopumilus planktonicus]QDD07325.1 division/cell wall cluster transcriptional repressor MraZ [Candidatus Methylopumilus planktonicus]QDD08654.1 division/cell wall cluster transcriptional repressor MraZ [Candidatus Methylopumilus planktonicus]QDD09977.1 division/cell wall cluster transcriptional repressor MraZ [Candidatus Methylopumilus planktonicus]
MFRGANLLNIDAKGRMAMPTKHREDLLTQSSGDLVITAHPHGCLLIYPKMAWEPIQSKIMALSSFDKKSSALQRLLVGYAEDISLDTAGRLLLSQVLREFAEVDKQAMLVGQGSHFELWDKEAWDQQMQQATKQEASTMPIELEGFSL